MNIFVKDRNAPCICGSGKKYKKCCLFTLEKLQRQWDREKYLWLTSDMVLAMSLICGLPRRDGEVVPAIADIEEALDYINEGIYQASEDVKSIEKLAEVMMQFERLLHNNASFADVFFSDELVDQYFALVNEELEDSIDKLEEEDIREAFEACMDEYLSGLIDEETTGHLVLNLISLMRKGPYTLAERAALLYAIYICLIDPYVNPVWEAVFRVSASKSIQREEEEPEPFIPEQSWPIVKAYIPEQECWNIGGTGSAGIVQQQADGHFCLTIFYLDLPIRQISFAWSKKDLSEEGLKDFLADMWLFCPPWEEGTLEKASSYIWGVYAWAITEGIGQEEIEPYLEVIPQPKGEQKEWLQDLLWGRELTNPKLIKVLKECGSPKELPEGKTYFVETNVIYRVSNPPLFIAQLSQLPDYEIEEIVPGEEWSILRLADYPEGTEPMPEDAENIRRVVAKCTLAADVLKVGAPTLTTAVQVVQELKHYTGKYLTYEGVTWTSYQEMLRTIKKQGERRKAPVKKNQTEKLF